MSEVFVGEGTTVTLNFSLSLENGDVIDSNMDAEPATFTFGDGSLLPGFEEAIKGMQAGEEGTKLIAAEQGFGQKNPKNIQTLPRSSFATDMELHEGLVVSFSDPAGGELPGVISQFNDSEVNVDFNHPLSGHDIVFDVRIVKVEPAVTH